MYGARKDVRVHADERDIGEPFRRYGTLAIRAGGHVLSAKEPLPARTPRRPRCDHLTQRAH